MYILCIINIFMKIILENCHNEVLPEGDRERCVKVTCTSQKKFTIEE